MKNVLKMLASEWKFLLKAVIGCGIVIFIVLFTITSAVKLYHGDTDGDTDEDVAIEGFKKDTLQLDTTSLNIINVDSIVIGNEKD
tara:strand:+ start:3945 stop:4199 length:255 start_codon:yes stop_codon:yes gene_type:complete